MDSINKEHIISGIIGGLTVFAAGFAARRLWGKRRGGHCGKWREYPKLEFLQSNKMPAAIGPYSHGKMIVYANGAALAYTSGQLGLNPETNALVSENVEE
jgi:hypothetical protein